MMLRVKQLDSITFNMGTMFIDEETVPEIIDSNMRMSCVGTHIVFNARINTPYLTLSSSSNSWLTEQKVDQLKTLWKDKIDDTIVITYDDDSTEDVRFAYEKDLTFTPIYEGACYYTASIPLAKV